MTSPLPGKVIAQRPLIGPLIFECFRGTVDLSSGKYEGGCVLWECSVDLISYLETIEMDSGLRVLDLGCGQGKTLITNIFTEYVYLPKEMWKIFVSTFYSVFEVQ